MPSYHGDGAFRVIILYFVRISHKPLSLYLTAALTELTLQINQGTSGGLVALGFNLWYPRLLSK